MFEKTGFNGYGYDYVHHLYKYDTLPVEEHHK
jgi:hypothetical protein